MKTIKILGIRGIPASHGGFETFAERLALSLVSSGWKVEVYCQAERGDALNAKDYSDSWNGIVRHHIYPSSSGALATIEFDARSVVHASRSQGINLTLGYNTAFLNFIFRLRGQPNIINMDGVEWRRGKWSPLAKFWFWINEYIAAAFGNALIADHPEIANHLKYASAKVSMIPYGGEVIVDANIEQLKDFSLRPFEYGLLIARPEPENSIQEIVRAWSSSSVQHPLVILGNYSDAVRYHKIVLETADDRSRFVGAIYDKSKLAALRQYAAFYIHGHTVGGTNPSLVEALGAGSAIIAHDNKFNRWVAGAAALYFQDEAQLKLQIEELFLNNHLLMSLKAAAKARHLEKFQWDSILEDYQILLTRFI